MRLDAYLAQYFPEHSRSAWQKYIAAGKVKVNDEIVTSNKYMLGEDDAVTVDTFIEPDLADFTLPIIYEDENVVVVNKPVGVLSHAKGGIVHEKTVADFFKDKTTFGVDTNRAGIIHRLDRATSGVMIGVKNNETAKSLQQQFSDHKAKKTYIAIVKGIPDPAKARLELPIERNPKKPSQFRVGAGGKSATTVYEVLKSTKDFSLIRLTPTTGRTHQLRVHMAYIGYPIVGDPIYGNEPADRMYLHAAEIEITIPKGKRQTFKADLPVEFTNFMSGNV